MLTKSLENSGFKQSDADDCLFTYNINQEVCYVVVHVDDVLFAATSEEIIKSAHSSLQKDFQLKDLGYVKHFLGLDIHKSEDGFYAINQETYIAKIADQLDVRKSSPQKFPIHPGYYGDDSTEFLNENTHFRKVIGMLLYVATHSRPDISAGVCILAQRCEHPRQIDLDEALRIVKYLNGTIDYKLHLNRPNVEQKLLAYSDANFAECKLNAKSNTGLIIFVNGGAISWKCKKQTNVAMSTCEAEYYSVTEAAKEVIWLRKLLESFAITSTEPTTIFNDNQACIEMIEDSDFKPRTKYIGVRYHFIRDWVARKVIELYHCPTEYNIADMLTKPLNGPRITSLRCAAGVLSGEAVSRVYSTFFPS